ncbi:MULTISPECIES: DUF3742 family protein [Pseudomonas syringae group genomosp. 2]|uniref:DUF3742 family protein n=3 Tax=Pseudomonas amygdali TaxID=47877 RepID=A0AAX1VPC6_PSEAJ|nr:MULTISPECIES: DUF3742 family protein [Pseudomonas syringae group genomosp. 2]KEZ27451.1 hypothetical protein A3SK_0109210 [Pseudomonas amygdali pv. tabaci str. 6605]KEZ64482.1 hypothetical protein C1E_0226820 [Pseudomonas amygdali pv. tabaci str. ATCC 11528]QED82879.1 DUF3742 family protein [Pseudomonas amygdali pv. tabaci str. ATCC 11528]QOI03142.1 DUF3742 family protein [Pseudomonas savastanoi]RML76351.1 hypothetical protein ALQ89_200062 [Pseudomonas amygdali pv. tabaci]
MSTVKVQGSAAMRIGQGLGRGVAAVLRLEKALWSSLSRFGVPELIVSPVKWAVRLATIGFIAFFAAWGLLYVVGVIAIVAIAIGLMNTSTQGDALSHSLKEEELPYGMESNVFGQTKGWFDSDSEYK